MPAEKLRQQKALAAAANAGNNLDEAIVLRGNQLAKVQISFYRHAGIISRHCGHVNVAMLKLVRYMTYFKHIEESTAPRADVFTRSPRHVRYLARSALPRPLEGKAEARNMRTSNIAQKVCAMFIALLVP